MDLLTQAGVDARAHAEGLPHDGIELLFKGECATASTCNGLTGGKQVTVYGQTEVTRDLMEAREAAGLTTIYHAANACPCTTSTAPTRGSATRKTASRTASTATSSPAATATTASAARACLPARCASTKRSTPSAGWACWPTCRRCRMNSIYANTARGFALCSMRSETRSRYYVQVPTEEKVENWSDEASGTSCATASTPKRANASSPARRIEKSVAPLRSFVAEPMRFGSLFLAGDAAHIVPPTGAKGLNLATADVGFLSRALEVFYRERSASALDRYSDLCLRRVWKAERFSWWFTSLMHRFPDTGEFGQKIQEAELDYLIQLARRLDLAGRELRRAAGRELLTHRN